MTFNQLNEHGTDGSTGLNAAQTSSADISGRRCPSGELRNRQGRSWPRGPGREPSPRPKAAASFTAFWGDQEEPALGRVSLQELQKPVHGVARPDLCKNRALEAPGSEPPAVLCNLPSRISLQTSVFLWKMQAIKTSWLHCQVAPSLSGWLWKMAGSLKDLFRGL